MKTTIRGMLCCYRVQYSGPCHFPQGKAVHDSRKCSSDPSGTAECGNSRKLAVYLLIEMNNYTAFASTGVLKGLIVSENAG